MTSSPSVTCAVCGTVINEPTDIDPERRRPCPRCGATNRLIRVSAAEQLNIIDGFYAGVSASSNARIDQLTREAASAGEIGQAPGPIIPEKPVQARTPLEIQADLVRAEVAQITAAITTLIDTVRVGQSEDVRSAGTLIKWTRVIGVATLLSLLIAVVAILVAVYRR